MKYIYLLISLLFSLNTLAQNPISYSGPGLIEKGYLHTDRSFYFPGETIWFKGYLTQGENIPAPISDYAYAHLIAPDGSLVSTGTYKIKNGTIFGQFTINADWIGGIYKLKLFTQWMLNEGADNGFVKNITIQKIILPKLQMKFDFSKETYGPGSEVKATVNIKDLENNALAQIESNISVAIGGKNYVQKKVIADQDGNLNLLFHLPEDLNTTDILVNCILQYKGDTESISRSVPVLLDMIDLQWFPESGLFLQGLTNTIAFKAVNEYGKPADIKGYIKNNKDEMIAEFDSFHDGMGAVQITPKANEIFTAHITYPITSKKEYLLPVSEKEGIVLQVDSIGNDFANFNIRSSENFSGIISAVEAQNTLYSKPLLLKKGSQKVRIPIDTFKKGITKFNFQTDDCKFTAERLVFIHYDRKLNIQITTDKQQYNTREKINVSLLTTDQNGSPVPANLSLAAVNSKILSFADDRQDNILSYFLMSSELNGSIHKPNFYFDPNEESKAQRALDYVLLTHGWRKYMYHTTYTTTNATFPPENGTLKTGQVLDSKGNGVQATILVFETGAQRALPIAANENGYFSFVMDTANYVTLVAYNDSNKKLTILMKSTSQQGLPDSNTLIIDKTIKENKETLFKPNARKNKLNVTPRKNPKITLNSENALNEVIVTAQGIKREKKALGYAVSAVEDEELDLTGDASRILSGKASGVTITSATGSSGATSNVVIRGYSSISGNNQALFIVDGIPFSTDSSAIQVSLTDIDPSQIESINVIKGLAATTLYGTAGRNGVIVISTKKNHYGRVYGMKRLGTKKYKNYTSLAVYNNTFKRVTQSTLFYTPVYDSKKISKERTDFRQTLYWNPIIETNKNGKATFNYYNSDETTSITLIAEGLGANGDAGRGTHSYAIQKPLSIDFKISPYLSVGDELSLEVIIQNNTNQELVGELDLLLPKEIKRLNPSNNGQITVPKNSFRKLIANITLHNTLSKGQIKARFKTADTQETLVKPIEIVSPNFPVTTTINGSKSGDYYFDIENAVPSSITADLTVYTDVIGDVMDGIASMLREPHGCFEQTSSSTYPNVMVLQYLRESGKSNIEIEEKALAYISKGYKRLISFETSQGGFEWFGKTPPHETLTAYGVLEFTEMKNVYPKVSQSMINRTVQWLMSRKDGKGGFRKSKKGYDSFASSTMDVANAYILYALSESGHYQHLSLEYETALLDAKKSNDAYKIALLANTAYNTKNYSDYSELLEILTAIINTYGLKELPVKSTITRSYGNAKQIEALAFTALAMMKSDTIDQVQLSKIIETILTYRSYNRFGSTQSTVMALKALIEYTRLKKQAYVEDQNIVLTINRKEIPLHLKKAKNGKLAITNLGEFLRNGENSIEIKYSKPNDKVPYSLNVAWASTKPATHPSPFVSITTVTEKESVSLGETIRQTIKVTNIKNNGLGMITAVVGIPAGTTAQAWQLKELMDTNQIAYYELYDNFLVLYWRSFKPDETKTITIDLKTEIKGKFRAPASNAYPYYGDEIKYWTVGTEVTIL